MKFDVTILFTGLMLYQVYGESANGGQDREVNVLLLNPEAEEHEAELHVTVGSSTEAWDLATGDLPVLGQSLAAETLTRVPRQAIPPSSPAPSSAFEHQFQWVPNLAKLSDGELNLLHESISHTIEIRGGRLESTNLGKSSGSTLVWRFLEDETLRRRQALAEWVLLTYRNFEGEVFPIELGGEMKELKPDPDSGQLALTVSNMPAHTHEPDEPPYVIEHFNHFYPLVGKASGPLPQTSWKPDRAVPTYALASKPTIIRALNAFCPPASWIDE